MSSSHQQKKEHLAILFAKAKYNEESDENRLRRQPNEQEEKYKQLQTKFESISLENETLQQRELLGENTNVHQMIDKLNQKIALNDALKESFIGSEFVRIKEEKRVDTRVIKIAKRRHFSGVNSLKIDENNPDDATFLTARFLGRPTKKLSDVPDEYPHKRAHLIDRLNDIALYDRTDCDSFFYRQTPQ